MRSTRGIVGATLTSGALIVIGGCCSAPCESKPTMAAQAAPCPCPEPAKMASLPEWPPNASPGECYAKVFVPPKTETVTEKVCVREATQHFEVIPAQYEWVEEKVLVKDASTEIVEVPGEMKTEEKKVLVSCPETRWEMDAKKNCASSSGLPVQGSVWCLVNKPAEYKTVTTNCVCKPTTTKTVTIPAEYESVKRQKLVAAATTKCVTTPAEFETLSRTVAVGPGHWEWQRVLCDGDVTTDRVNAIKAALMASGFQPGPLDGEWGAQDWSALTEYQKSNGLGVGALSYESVAMLNVAPR